VRLIIAVPVVGSPRRIKIILPLDLRHMAIAEKQIIAVGMRWRGFTAIDSAGDTKGSKPRQHLEKAS
jgi:hypothetical protein